MTKYELIDEMVVKLDALVDMRGVEKCRMVIELVSELAELKGQLAREDDATKDASPLPDGGRIYKIKENGDE